MKNHHSRSKDGKTKRPSSPKGYNTNLASEFFVLSTLYRLGLDANLTLGNKKSVDITVVLGPGRAVTVDVKAVAGKMDWLMGGIQANSKPQPNHFVVLVSYEGKIGDPTVPPRCWVVPLARLLSLVKTAGGSGTMRYLSRKQALSEFSDHEGAWHLLSDPA